MSIKDKLDIFLITYNRKPYLQRTLDKILAEDSPIRDFDITILDNHSTDGTTELIDQYAKRFHNLKHIIHNRNINGNGNIARAFELAKKDYIWVLCDDDDYDWTYWNEVEEALISEFDAIIVHTYEGITDLPVLLNLCAFVGGAMYKTSNITESVMQNILINIYACFPHIVIPISLINNKKKFFCVKHDIIFQKNIGRGINYRGINEIHFRTKIFNLFVGYIDSYRLINDKKLRYLCNETLYIGKTFFYSMRFMLRNYDFYWLNFFDILVNVHWRQKIKFLFACFLYMLESLYHKLFSRRNKKCGYYYTHIMEKIMEKRTKNLTVLQALIVFLLKLFQIPLKIFHKIKLKIKKSK